MDSKSTEVPGSVPIVDITPFTTGGTLEAQKKTARELAEKASQNGCIGISGHNVPNQMLSEAFAMTKKLFDLPYESKMKAPHPAGPTPHRGYSGTGRENAARKTETEHWEGTAKASDYVESTDYKESYEIGSDENKAEYNIWLPEEVFPGFREWGLRFYWELNQAGSAIFEALMMSLELEEREMENVRGLHSGHDNQLRLLHYPPVEDVRLKSGNKHRLGAHTDWSLFTILFQDAHGGLQFLDRSTGEFLDAVPKDGVLYMNIGDMFQRVSNGFYPSALHRVVAKDSNASRYSIPYFVAPTPDGVIVPQPSRIARDGEKRYEAITFRKFSEQMFKTIGVYS